MATRLPLGELAKVRLRDAWENEAIDFTPWLSENIGLVSEVIDIPLEVEATEQQVGPFRADIVCRNLTDGSLVLVENQIERTDHSHLGQLLTYAAGLEAATVVWVAERFTEEHRAALDWLNTITTAKFNFFGLEAELWQIAGSPVAPKLNLVSKPNEWVRTAAQNLAVTEATPKSRRQLEFWTAFSQLLANAGSTLKTSPPSGRPNLQVAVGRTGFTMWLVLTNYNPVDQVTPEKCIRAEITIDHLDAEGMFNALLLQRDSIEAKIGSSLVWMPADGGTRRRRAFLTLQADFEDRADWPRQLRWLKESAENLHAVFAPIFRDLQPFDSEAVAGA